MELSILGFLMSQYFIKLSVGSKDCKLQYNNPGCRIPVVRMLWEHVDWVQFPAARPR
jgi:hypothetical protein